MMPVLARSLSLGEDLLWVKHLRVQQMILHPQRLCPREQRLSRFLSSRGGGCRLSQQIVPVSCDRACHRNDPVTFSFVIRLPPFIKRCLLLSDKYRRCAWYMCYPAEIAEAVRVGRVTCRGLQLGVCRWHCIPEVCSAERGIKQHSPSVVLKDFFFPQKNIATISCDCTILLDSFSSSSSGKYCHSVLLCLYAACLILLLFFLSEILIYDLMSLDWVMLQAVGLGPNCTSGFRSLCNTCLEASLI